MDWMPILSKVIEVILIAVLPPLAIALIALIVAQARKTWLFAKDRWPQATDLLDQAACLAVRAAEQAGLGGLIKDKKTYAIQIAEKWLAARGLDVDLDLIDAAIEAAVITEFPHEPDKKVVGYSGVIDEGKG